MAHKEGDRQNSYTKGLKGKEGGGQGHVNPYQWKKPKTASKKVDKKAFDSNFS